MTKPEIENLKKLAPVPNLPINQLMAQLANFRCITSDTDQPWIYYVGGGARSGLVLLIVMCCMLYWCCKRTKKLETKLPPCVTNADLENPNRYSVYEVGQLASQAKSCMKKCFFCANKGSKHMTFS